ncbi:MAG TPA: MBL fold metallo-hydrolase [Thermoflexia bacterium]|jgi:glyoxylase-like metal-dependent hydrolase (beta-lactamase superfamily II)|nr:MBL fold metallo-hydrolase [Thermoflexia bacterium]
MEEIIPGVYVATFYPDINVGFICVGGGAIAIDAPALPSDAHVWREAILQTAGGPVRYTILTDHRLDRALSARLLGAPVIAGRAALLRLKELRENEADVIRQWMRLHGREEDLEGHHLSVPEIGVDGRLTLHDSLEVVIKSIPGATPGSVWVRLPGRKLLFTGDTLVVNTHPLLDEAPDTGAWLRTLTRLRRPHFPAEVIVPGRGPVCEKEATRPLSDYIQQARRRVRSLHTAGQGRSALLSLVEEFLGLFPVEKEEEGRIRERVRAGLERVFDELAPRES